VIEEAEVRPLRVGVIGAAPRVREHFAALFDGPGRRRYVLVEAPAAEVLVVDLDGEEAEAAWSAHRAQAPQTPTLLVGSDPGRFPAGARSLSKPLAPSGFLAALAALRFALTAGESPPRGHPVGAEATELLPGRYGGPGGAAPTLRETPGPAATETEDTLALGLPSPPEPLTERLDPRHLNRDPPLARDLCGESEDLDLDGPHLANRLFLETEGHLLGVARRAAAQARASGGGWRLRLGDAWVRGTAGGGPVYASLTPTALRELCRTELPEVASDPLPAAGVPVRPGPDVLFGASWESLEAFLWQTALWTYRGRLPAGTAVHGRVYLARWPNLTRLAEVPHAIRVAALWLAQPVSLAFTARALGIPQRYVFAFYGAAHALGLAGQARRASDYLFEPAVLGAVEDRRVLSGVVSRLKGLVGG
jgi:hypothetical protein